MSILRRIYRPEVRDELELGRYARSVTLFAGATALVIDIFNHLVFFVGWSECLRDWGIDIVAVVAVAYPIARSIGRAHLELFHAQRDAERLSRIDHLTGLANRRAFYDAAARLCGAAAMVAIADIDRFKRINDQHGHAVGDEIIRAVSARMAEELADLGTVARIGGEEFALVGRSRPAEELRARLQRFARSVALIEVATAGEPALATVSIGFAAGQDLGLDALHAAADKALYVAKSAGRDRVVDFDEIGELGAPAALRAS